MIPAVRTILVIARDGALVLIDSVSLGFLKGAEIDFATR